MLAPHSCEELDRFIREACAAIAEARRIRMSQDMSFQEDIRLSREEHARLYGVIKHLLVGHEGKPCPAGGRPIVTAIDWQDSSSWNPNAKLPKSCSGFPRQQQSA